MLTETQKLRNRVLLNDYASTPIIENLQAALQRDYGLTSTQAEIIITKAACGNRNMSQNANPIAFIESAQSLAEFFVLMENDGCLWDGETAKYMAVPIRNLDKHLTVLCRVRPDRTSKFDPEVRLIANIKSAAEEYLTRFHRRNKTGTITWLDIQNIPADICQRHGFQILEVRETEMQNALNTLAR